jgi:hypothetical protein
VTDDALALAFRTGLPFVGLRDHAHDPALDELIPPDAARTARAVPLVAYDDRIRLAVADPEPDLSTLGPYLNGRQIELALAPREELDVILGPPPLRPDPATAAERLAEPEGEAAPAVAGEVDDERGTEGEAAAAAVGAAEPGEQGGEDETAADAVAAAEAGAEPVAATEAGAEPVGADESGAEPLAAAEAAAEPVAAAEAGAEPVAADESGAEPLAAAEAGAEPVAATEPRDDDERPGPDSVDAAPAEAPSLAAEAAPAAPVDDHPELAGEVPSWLEPRRTGRRILLLVVVFIVLLVAAAAVVIAVANA